MKTKMEKTVVAVLSGILLVIVCGIITLTVLENTESDEQREMQTYELQLPSVDEVVDWYKKQEQEPEQMPDRDTKFEGNKL